MTTQIPPDSWERVGATLRVLRESRGLTPDELATRAEISRPYLANIEAGRKRLTPVLLHRFAVILCIPPIALVDARDDLDRAS